MIKGFKEFIAQGNALELAVAVIIGGAFKPIVDSITKVIMTIIGQLIGQPNFDSLGAFSLYQDGSFQLAATFYDGTALITGTYTQEEGVYVLAPTESTSQGVAGSDVGEMRLSPSGEGYTYSGGQLGLTFDGASFLPEGA